MEPYKALQTFQYMLKYGSNPEALDITISYFLICFK